MRQIRQGVLMGVTARLQLSVGRGRVDSWQAGADELVVQRGARDQHQEAYHLQYAGPPCCVMSLHHPCQGMVRKTHARVAGIAQAEEAAA